MAEQRSSVILNPVARLAIDRVVGALITLWLTLTVVFILGSMIGDPVLMLLGEGAPQDQVEALRHELGFDKPITQQYLFFISNYIKGDLGESFRYGRTNSSLIWSRLPFTLQLAAGAIFLGVIVGMSLGVLAGWKADSIIDRISTTISLLGQSTPRFFLGLLLILVFS